MGSGAKLRISPPSPSVIGTRSFKGTVRTDFAAEKIVSRHLSCSGARAAAHQIESIEGCSLVKIKSLQLHFSWNKGHVSGITRTGVRSRSYDNRPRYLYVVSSPAELQFEMEKSTFNELAIEFDQSFLWRTCEAPDSKPIEIPETWACEEPLYWEIAEVIYEECMQGARNGSLYAETALTLLALHLARNAGNSRVPNLVGRGGLSPTGLRRSCEYMVGRLDEDVPLAAVAFVTGFSPGHFAYAFKRSTGISPHAWLRHQRIEKAKDLLRDHSLEITTIASAVGYATQSAFGVAFKKETGRTPLEWRRCL
jgi:AraC family transcriptional regulator